MAHHISIQRVNNPPFKMMLLLTPLYLMFNQFARRLQLFNSLKEAYEELRQYSLRKKSELSPILTWTMKFNMKRMKNLHLPSTLIVFNIKALLP